MNFVVSRDLNILTEVNHPVVAMATPGQSNTGSYQDMNIDFCQGEGVLVLGPAKTSVSIDDVYDLERCCFVRTGCNMHSAHTMQIIHYSGTRVN